MFILESYIIYKFFNNNKSIKFVYDNFISLYMLNNKRNVSMGNNCSFYRNINIWSKKLEIGSSVSINSNWVIIKKDTILVIGIVLASGNHRIAKNEPIRVQKPNSKGEIIISEDCFVGISANVVILPGVCIGNGAVIGVESIVTKNIEV